MKREPSDTPSDRSMSHQPSDHAGSPTPHIPKKPKVEAKSPSPTKKSPAKTPRKAKADSQENGTWTAEKRLAVMREVIEIGCKGVDIGALAQQVGQTADPRQCVADVDVQLGLSKKQIKNQLDKGRTGSLRDKALKAVGIE